MATTFHEVWKPTVNDNDLQKRMGTSYATNAFKVVQVALRREMVLALTRIWDKDRGGTRLGEIASTLRDRNVLKTLAIDRASKPDLRGNSLTGAVGPAHAEIAMKNDLSQHADKALALLDKYSHSGPGRPFLETLRGFRHQFLAHRQLNASPPGAIDEFDEKLENFYKDTGEIIRLVLKFANGEAHDFELTASVYREYAKYFWAPTLGERTEGHPNYKTSNREAILAELAKKG